MVGWTILGLRKARLEGIVADLIDDQINLYYLQSSEFGVAHGPPTVGVGPVLGSVLGAAAIPSLRVAKCNF